MLPFLVTVLFTFYIQGVLKNLKNSGAKRLRFTCQTGSRLARKTSTCNKLSKLLYRPDDDPVKGRNIVARAKHIYT
jgi:hypothetical protein